MPHHKAGQPRQKEVTPNIHSLSSRRRRGQLNATAAGRNTLPTKSYWTCGETDSDDCSTTIDLTVILGTRRKPNNLWRHTENTPQPINHNTMRLSSCRWRCMKVQLVGLHALQRSQPALNTLCLHQQPESLSPLSCAKQTERQTNVSVGQPEIIWHTSPAPLAKKEMELPHFKPFCRAHEPHCASQCKQLSSVHRHSNTAIHCTRNRKGKCNRHSSRRLEKRGSSIKPDLTDKNTWRQSKMAANRVHRKQSFIFLHFYFMYVFVL